MLQILGIFSGILAILQYFPYVRDILKRKTKPQRTTYFIYTILTGISFFAQLSEGATDSLWLTAGLLLGTLLTFILSIKFGVGGHNLKDFSVLIFATLGLALWYFTSNAVFALIIVILIDIFATALVIEKAFKYPNTETLSTWLISSISALLAVLAVGELNLILISYPLTICLVDGGVVLAILLGRKRKII